MHAVGREGWESRWSGTEIRRLFARFFRQMSSRYNRIDTDGSAPRQSNFAPLPFSNQYQEQQHYQNQFIHEGYHPMPSELLQDQSDPRWSNQPHPAWQEQQQQQQWQPQTDLRPPPSQHYPEIQEDDGSLRAVRDLPTAFRPLFSFKYFNTVQSSCYSAAYESDINMVVSAPTGSGKVHYQPEPDRPMDSNSNFKFHPLNLLPFNCRRA